MGAFSWITGNNNKQDLLDLYPMPIANAAFVKIDVVNLYKRILTDAFERCDGIPEAAKPLLWDNCLKSNKQDGLVTLLANAMYAKADLFLVYRSDLKVIRVADQAEMLTIKSDYEKTGESKTGIYVTFKNFEVTDMVKFYSGLEYCAVAGLWKQGNLSTAIQFKISDLRSSVSLADKASAQTQAQAIVNALAEGKSVSMDAKDLIETQAPDLTATKASIDFVTQKRASYLGLPASYFDGEQSSGTMSDSGKADEKAVDRGLKGWFVAICKPVADGIFKVTCEYKSDDNEGTTVALQMLKDFDLTSNEFLSADNKQKQINKAFGLAENAVGDGPALPDPKVPKVEAVPPKDPKKEVQP